MEKILVKDVAQAVHALNVVGNNEGYIQSVITDSREKKLNSLFVAIKGENVDGHKYIKGAYENGAVAVLVNENFEDFSETITYIVVKDTVKALQDFATWYRLRFDIPVVAVTGSVGKTTTKDMIYSVLKEKYNVLKTEGNLNSEIGAPMTILNLNSACDIAVIEMGMDHFGQIDTISKIVKPETAVITNIGVAHIEFLKSRENILKAKCEVLDNMDKTGTAILNIDDDMLSSVKKDLNIVWYGEGENANVRAENIVVDYNNGKVKAKVFANGNKYELVIPGLSRHLVHAALSAIAVGLKYNMDMESILKGIANYTHTKMRMDIYNLNENILLIDDTYNANPVSMKALIDVLAKMDKKKILIMGDMFELGENEVNLHKEVLEYAISLNMDKIVLTGNIMKSAVGMVDKNKISYFNSKEELIENLNNIIEKDSVIGVKASRGMKFENITEKVIEIYGSL